MKPLEHTSAPAAGGGQFAHEVSLVFVHPSAVADALEPRWQIARGSVRLLIWGGLRGGISAALALTLPPGPHRESILAITYGVVVSSILVQGLSIKLLARRLVG